MSATPRVPPGRVRILHLEDDPADAELVSIALRRDFGDAELILVQNRASYVAALERGGWNIVLSDYAVPGFDGLQAAELLHRSGSDVPFVLVTGTIGDEGAAAALRAGVTDYVLKDQLERLGPAVRRALEEVRERTAGMGIVTDGDDENVSRLVRKLRLGPYFDTVVTSESVRLYKPNPGIYQVALERLRAEARRGLFVSDTPLDLEGAHAAGMAPALLARSGWPSEVPRPPGAIALSTPDELIPVLEGFCRNGRFEETHGLIGSFSPA